MLFEAAVLTSGKLQLQQSPVLALPQLLELERADVEVRHHIRHPRVARPVCAKRLHMPVTFVQIRHHVLRRGVARPVALAKQLHFLQFERADAIRHDVLRRRTPYD
jgi:hypothetical protein